MAPSLPLTTTPYFTRFPARFRGKGQRNGVGRDPEWDLNGIGVYNPHGTFKLGQSASTLPPVPPAAQEEQTAMDDINPPTNNTHNNPPQIHSNQYSCLTLNASLHHFSFQIHSSPFPPPRPHFLRSLHFCAMKIKI